jgi:hypothetical protein
MVVGARVTSSPGRFPEDPPPITVGDFVRVESWWLPAYPVPAVAGDALTIRYVQPDSTVWQRSPPGMGTVGIALELMGVYLVGVKRKLAFFPRWTR